MNRYITFSAFLHLLLFLSLWIPFLISTEPEPEFIRIQPPPPAHVEEEPKPEETAAPTPTKLPTPDMTNARSMVGEDLPTPTPTLSPTSTATLAPTKTPTPTPTETKVKPSPTPTSTQAPVTATPTKKPTAKATEKPTEKPTKTAAPTQTPKPTKTAAATHTPQPTASPTPDKKATEQAKKEKALQQVAEVLNEQKTEDPPTDTQSASSAAAVAGPAKGENLVSQGGGIKSSRDFTDRGYLLRLSQSLQNAFEPPRVSKDGGDRITTVYFKILADGTIVDWQVIKSSGHQKVDRAALRAVQETAQFEPIPGGLSDLEVSCDFKVE